ncbi:peptidase M24, structural domain-containing protein [Cubamyces menziesii]|nr:peptidase M24, structural domain-containing protein [Cubamyces menziesii]
MRPLASCARPLLSTLKPKRLGAPRRPLPRHVLPLAAQHTPHFHGQCRLNSTSSPSSPDDIPPDTEPSEHDLRFGYYDILLPSEPFVWGTTHILPRPVPPHIRKPPYVPELLGPDAEGEGDSVTATQRRLIRDPEDVEKLKRAARLAGDVLEFAGSLVQVGRTTDAIDAAVHELILACGAYPSPLLYKGFPKSCCTSVNNVITHGIPDDRPLQDGDIVNVDITVHLDGFHGDTSRTFLVGDVDDKGRELVQLTDAALEAGISVCGPGRPFKSIGRAIHELLRGKDYCVSPQFSGHGIGREFHRQPWIFHHLNDEPGEMRPGDCFTIEPAIIQGTDPHGWTFPDGWTVSTENCARAAQAEHMVYITENGAEVLTRRP